MPLHKRGGPVSQTSPAFLTPTWTGRSRLEANRFGKNVLAETPRGGNPPAQRQGMSLKADRDRARHHRVVGAYRQRLRTRVPGHLRK